MSKVIKVENLSKAYQLGDFGTGTISRDLERFFARLRGKEDPFLKIGEVNDRTTKGESDVVWSLKDIDFEVEQGDAVGIIGRNGAGKSTLLKILSRVTSPTTGSVKLRGRIASLLEVGTGFHPELSGRENIYLNGAILGMRKAEIKRKFDEIVSFSGVERYIDTPVKRYSSGMYVRLAFAVAAHLESEILIVDEVLAVGDAEFQKKCLGKMGEVSRGQGRTVLFVSHNMAAVNQLCKKAILLKHGMVEGYDQVSKITTQYFSDGVINESIIDLTDAKRKGSGIYKFKTVALSKRPEAEPVRSYSIGDTICILFKMERMINTHETIRASIELKSSDGTRLANMIDVDSNFTFPLFSSTIAVTLSLKDVRLYPDTYYLSLYAGDTSSSEIFDYIEDCISFEIIDGGNLTKRPLPKSAGLLFLTPTWEITT